MSVALHADQFDISTDTVRQLVTDQFPQWAHRQLSRVDSHGTAHALFRIGPDLVARLALRPGDPATRRAEIVAEHDAARRLSAVSTVPTPAPVAVGAPGAGYPLPWSVQQWLPGRSLMINEPEARSTEFAIALAGFVATLRTLPTEGRVFHGTRRGGQLTDQDDWMAHCLAQSRGLMDVDALRDLWSQLRKTPRPEPDAWTHGDLMPGNLLSDGQRLSGVIDVELLGVADPALDLQPAWNFFTPGARTAFRATLDPSEDEWQRGRGWAFAQAMGCLWYYRESNPVMSETARHTLAALLSERP